jgi:PrsW family intramembrane metalloprotease
VLAAQLLGLGHELARAGLLALPLLLLVAGGVTVRRQRYLEAAWPSAWALSWILLALHLLPMVAWRLPARPLRAGAPDPGRWRAAVRRGLRQRAGGARQRRLELVKGCGVVLLYLIAAAEFDDIMDGFVYGAMVGLGFAVVEGAVYFVLPGGHAGDVLGGFFARVVASGLYGHVLHSGQVGGPGLPAGELEVLSDPGRRRAARRELRRGHGRGGGHPAACTGSRSPWR